MARNLIGFRPNRQEFIDFQRLLELHPDRTQSDLVREAVRERLLKELPKPASSASKASEKTSKEVLFEINLD